MEINSLLSNLLNHNENLDYIEILGYKISFEDLLLLGIIFCLYKEGVEDQLLFICLLLLLLS